MQSHEAAVAQPLYPAFNCVNEDGPHLQFEYNTTERTFARNDSSIWSYPFWQSEKKGQETENTTVSTE